MTPTESLRTARGKAYYALLRQILEERGWQIASEARAVVAATGGKLTPLDIGALALKYDLNYKATCEWLEECQVIPTGTYSLLMDRGLKVREVLAAARQHVESKTQ